MQFFAAVLASGLLTVTVAAVPAQQASEQQSQQQGTQQGQQQGQQTQQAAPAAQAPQKATAVPVKPPQEEQKREAATPTKRQSLYTASDLVRVDVEVTDKSGKPVKGLNIQLLGYRERGDGS
jgi:hemolysin activation/secretion protein